MEELKEKKHGITFELLLELMSSISLDDNEPIDDSYYGKNHYEAYNYLQHKIMAQNEGFNELDGVNALVYDDKHNYLKDL